VRGIDDNEVKARESRKIGLFKPLDIEDSRVDTNYVYHME
jgi:hypothetical protein